MTTGKKTSMRLRRYELIEKIRRFMYRVEIGGSLVRHPDDHISDAAVVDFSLGFLMSTFLNPDALIISKSKHLKKVEDLVNQHVPYLSQLTGEQRRDYLEQLVCSQAIFAPFDRDESSLPSVPPGRDN